MTSRGPVSNKFFGLACPHNKINCKFDIKSNNTLAAGQCDQKIEKKIAQVLEKVAKTVIKKFQNIYIKA